jgi:glycyl-tRNA synthetase
MSLPAYLDLAQLRAWTEEELTHRDLAQASIVDTVQRSLSAANRAWTFQRVEAPMLMPRSLMSEAYTEDDIWTTNVTLAGQPFALRAETTPSTYAVIRALYPRLEALKPPRCFWQVGKSFRREPQSSANRLRFFEFTQLEFQSLYSVDTKADYRALVLDQVKNTLSWLCRSQARIVESDRLPSYSESTLDVEVRHRDDWREVASVSIRTDFTPFKNLEIAVGLDRIVSIALDTPENRL